MKVRCHIWWHRTFIIKEGAWIKMDLYYIRHGEPIYDPDSLTDKGHEQAALLVPYLLRCGLDRVYSSTSNRAMQTAQPTCDAMGIEMQLLDFANEKYAYRDFSIGEGNKIGRAHV